MNDKDCPFCNTTIYINTVQCLADALAPITRGEELRQQLKNSTGETYLPLWHKFCPMCGKKLEVEE